MVSLGDGLEGGAAALFADDGSMLSFAELEFRWWMEGLEVGFVAGEVFKLVFSGLVSGKSHTSRSSEVRCWTSVGNGRVLSRGVGGEGFVEKAISSKKESLEASSM